ncbi:MAG: hypothetical protein A2857_06560 [Candidatus Levybacteria bacterium RIFCSPHIGHO2_01_FULL_36_15]|nr:MAG: hypothetical protein A2857_06560 [Candidatus Levybacteria bacterium RIFCSPHIGHO2_01_FULL_36_15]OGH38817.1 MAG: hypothetical protein A2905_02555 [Candidatus Levybacteria bacterium RIFCSPLOWO2_01_FULL_36_10]
MDNQKYTVMVVEDEALLLQAIEKKLRLSGISVISCAGGNQAIEYLRTFQKLPDAIWLDYYLRDMSGLDLVNEIKKDEKLIKIPIVVISNSASENKVKTLLALGVKKYLLKSEYRLDDIIEIVRKIIDEKGKVVS